MSNTTARTATKAFALTRAAVGLAAIGAPKTVSSAWVGRHDDERDPVATVLGRALGGRDLALAAGILLSMRHDAKVRGWVEGAGLADAMDLVATVLSFRSLPNRTRWGILAVTGASVAASRMLSQVVDR